MTNTADREEYGLLVLIEKMQREGRPEGEIEAAVRDASQPRPRTIRHHPPRRPRRFDLLMRRSMR